MTCATCSHRSATKSMISVIGCRSRPFSRRARRISPWGQSPGSCVSVTFLPSRLKRAARRLACVDLPEPSIPSIVINIYASLHQNEIFTGIRALLKLYYKLRIFYTNQSIGRRSTVNQLVRELEKK